MPNSAGKPAARPGGHGLFRATIAGFALAERVRNRLSAAGLRSGSRVPARRRGRRGLSPKVSLFSRITRRTKRLMPDPVSLAVLAIDRVGPAVVRACASGVEVCVAAPDEATAAVFRAALKETARHRNTDRLIRIVVD